MLGAGAAELPAGRARGRYAHQSPLHRLHSETRALWEASRLMSKQPRASTLGVAGRAPGRGLQS